MSMPMGGGIGSHVDTGFDGSIGWTSSEWTGMEKVPQAQIDNMRAWRVGLPSYDMMRAVTFLGRQLFEKRPAVAIRYSADSSGWATDYYDLETGLKLATESEASPATGGKRFTQRAEDYQWVDGERVAMTTTLLSDGKPIGTIRILKLDHVPIDTMLFTMPAAHRKAPLSKP